MDIAIGIANALEEAHRKGLIHAHLSPTEIQVSDSLDVTLPGIQNGESAEETGHGSTGNRSGRSPYISPEQARSGAIDTRTDVWSLGVILYEMITGRPPFASDSEEELLYAIQFEQPEDPRHRRRGISADLERIIQLAMAKRPEKRYQHVGDMTADLRSVREGRSPVMATPHRTAFAAHRSFGISQKGPVRRLPAFQRVVFAVLIVLLVCLLGFVLWSRYAPRNLLSPGNLRLAVLPFQDMTLGNVPEEWGELTQKTIAETLTRDDRLTVVDPAKINEEIEQELGHRNPRRGRALFDVINRFEVYYTVDGGIYRSKEGYVLRSTLVEPFSTRALHTAEEGFTGPDDLPAAASALSQQVLEHLNAEHF